MLDRLDRRLFAFFPTLSDRRLLPGRATLLFAAQFAVFGALADVTVALLDQSRMHTVARAAAEAVAVGETAPLEAQYAALGAFAADEPVDVEIGLTTDGATMVQIVMDGRAAGLVGLYGALVSERMVARYVVPAGFVGRS